MMKKMFLIAEYCTGPFYMGWWLYLREHKQKNKRNSDGDWGWLRGTRMGAERHGLQDVFDELGLGRIIGGEGDGGAIYAFVKRFKLPKGKVAGKPRGCMPVLVDEYGRVRLTAKG